MTGDTTRTSALLQQAHRLFPGGTLGRYKVPEERNFVVAYAKGGHLTDLEGREYIDFVLGSGPMLIGHAHPQVTAAIGEQAARGDQFYWLAESTLELASMMVDAIPCAEQVRFCSSGAESTFYALRLARAFTGRDVILRFSGSYHGNHDYGMLGQSQGIPAGIAPSVITAPYNDIEAVRQLLDRHDGEVAAIIVEPMQRIVAPKPGFLAGLRREADRAGALLIFDEVVTGFRLAWGGAQEKYSVTPDLATYGKVIGGGLPLAAVAGRADILDLSNPARSASEYAYVSGTLSGNPLAAAAGVATLKVLQQPGAYAHLEHVSRRMHSGLSRIATELGCGMQVLGDGPVLGITFADGDPTSPDEVAKGDVRPLKLLESRLLGEGVFVNIPAKCYISLAHTDGDIDRALEAIESTLPACLSDAAARV